MDGQCDYYMPPKVPLGHKNMDVNLFSSISCLYVCPLETCCLLIMSAHGFKLGPDSREK